MKRGIELALILEIGIFFLNYLLNIECCHIIVASNRHLGQDLSI